LGANTRRRLSPSPRGRRFFKLQEITIERLCASGVAFSKFARELLRRKALF
jgi:hypothetical protein